MCLFALGCGRIYFDPRSDASTASDSVRPICFEPRVDLLVCDTCPSSGPVSVALGDVDKDGNADLVVGDDSYGIVAVRRGLGDGTFGSATTYPIDWGAYEVKIADLDADGLPDLAAVSWNTTGVKVFYGTGGGNFAAAVVVPGPSTPLALDIADLDGDGIFDFTAGGEDNRVHFVRGLGGRAYASTTPLVMAGNFYAVGVAELDHNTRPDIIATDGVTMLVVLLHDVAATTWTRTDIVVPSGAHGIAAGDLNRDGNVDLAVAARSGTLAILLGNGTSSFVRQDVAAGPDPLWPVAGDLDNDGDLDLVVLQANGGMLSVFVNDGSASFERRDYALADTGGGSGFSFAKVALADLNRDGFADLVASNPAGSNVAVFLSTLACP